MGDFVPDREARVIAVFRVNDFEAYMRDSHAPNVPSLKRVYDPCDGISYEDGYTNTEFRAWRAHLRFMEWEQERLARSVSSRETD